MPFTRLSEENATSTAEQISSRRSIEEISSITNRGRAARVSRRRAALGSALRCAACVPRAAHLCANVRIVERQDLDISCNKL